MFQVNRHMYICVPDYQACEPVALCAPVCFASLHEATHVLALVWHCRVSLACAISHWKLNITLEIEMELGSILCEWNISIGILYV